MKSKTKMSRICVIILALMMCISGIIMSPVAGEDASDENNTVVETSEEAQNSSESETNADNQTDPADPANLMNAENPLGQPSLMSDPPQADPKEGNLKTEKYVGVDKTKLIKNTIKYTVTQNDKTLYSSDSKENPDLRVLNPKQPFEITVTFSFPIINDDSIGKPEAQGINKIEQQINEGDFANFSLGDHFKPYDGNNFIPVRIVAQNHPDNHKLVGNIRVLKKGDALNAQMQFKSDPKDYYGDFEYESDTRRDITVQFTGKFMIDSENPPGTPDSKDRVIKILDKEYKLPDLEDNTYYSFTKSGKIDDYSKHDSITWECNIRKVSDTNPYLGGETFTDNLSEVGVYKGGSFTINGEKVKDNDPNLKIEGNIITYVFPKDFKSQSAKIKFQTGVIKDKIDDITATVKNKANLKIAADTSKIAETEVPVHNPLKITKTLEKIDIINDKVINKPAKQMIWTIVAGAPYENYGPAWIGDILSGKLKGQKQPYRIDLTYEHRFADTDKWKKVDSQSIKNKDTDSSFNPNNIPKFLDNGQCPSGLPNDEGIEIYELGRDWQGNPSDIVKNKDKNDEYYPVDNHWLFIKELKGEYRITVKLYFKEEDEVGPLKNEAEIHTCHDKGIITVDPPVFSATSSIIKEAGTRDAKDRNDINEGIMPWKITVDFGKVFPSDDRYVYEAFYWGSKDKFEEDKPNLIKPDDIPQEVFDALIEDKNDKNKTTRFNFNQAYVEGSLDLITDPKKADGQKPEETAVGGTPAPEEKLGEKVFILKDKNDNKVGQIVKISGFDKIKTYTFTLKTRAQDIIGSLKDITAEKKTYHNTAVLAIGKDGTFKTLFGDAYQQIPMKLLSKKLIPRGTDFKEINKPVKEGTPGDPKSKNYLTIGTASDGSGSAFDYKNKTIMFRIDVNPQGMDFAKYIENLSLKDKNADDFKFDKLVVTDTLGKGLTLEPIDAKNDYYIYEADPSQLPNLDQAQVIKKITPKEANVEFDKSKIAWTFSEYNNKPYVIVIKVKVSDETFKNYIKGTKEWDSNIIFENNVRLTVDERNMANAKSYESINKKPLVKENLTESKLTKPKDINIKWGFTYQPLGVKELGNIAFEDEINNNLALPIDDNGDIKLDNFEVERSNKLDKDGNYSEWEKVNVHRGYSTPSSGVNISYDDDSRKLTFKIPDDGTSYSYKFTYSTNLNMNPKDLNKVSAIRNTVKMIANGKETETVGIADAYTQRYSAYATIKDSPYFVIKKVDEKGDPLAGAVFEYTDKDGKKITNKTKKDGLFYVINVKPEDTIKVKETKAPSGYARFTQIIKVKFKDGKAKQISPTGIQGEGTSKKPYILKNYKLRYIDIPVTKKWVGDKDEDRPESITVKLIKNGVETDKTLELNKENGWSGKFKDLPATDGDGNSNEYKVSEVSVEGYKSEITGNQSEGFIITNTKPEKPEKPEKPDKPGKPGEPGEPGKPGEPGNPNGNGTKGNPGTGDTGFDYGWPIMAVAAGLGLIYLQRRKKQGRNS